MFRDVFTSNRLSNRSPLGAGDQQALTFASGLSSRLILWSREILAVGMVFGLMVLLGSSLTQPGTTPEPAATSCSEQGVIRLYPMAKENAVWVVRARGPIRLVSVASGEVVRSFEVPERAYPTFTASEDGESFLSISSQGEDSTLQSPSHGICKFDMRKTFEGQWPADFSFSPVSGRLLVTMSSGQVLEVEVESHRIKTSRVFASNALLAKYNKDGSRIVIARNDGSVEIIDTLTGTSLRRVVGRNDRAISAAWSDRGQIAVGYLGGAILCFDEAEEKAPVTSQIGTDQISSLAFSPDGSVLATGSFDKTCRLLNSSNLEQIRILKGHAGAVRQVCFVHDGQHLITGGLDGQIKVWGTSGSQPIYELAQ